MEHEACVNDIDVLEQGRIVDKAFNRCMNHLDPLAQAFAFNDFPGFLASAGTQVYANCRGLWQLLKQADQQAASA